MATATPFFLCVFLCDREKNYRHLIKYQQQTFNLNQRNDNEFVGSLNEKRELIIWSNVVMMIQ